MINKWAVTKSRYLVKDDWLTLREDVCQDGNVRIAPYYVFEYRPWVTIVPVTPQQELVLIRQYRHGSGCVEVELPGGNTEAYETDLAMAAARELEEETGYQADTLEELARVSPNSASHNNLSHLFLARNARATSAQKLDATENIEVFTLALADLPDALARGLFKQAMHVSALYFAMHHLGHLSYAWR